MLEELFLSNLNQISNKLNLDLKLLFTFTSNWLKFTLFDNEYFRDVFSTFELKFIFLGYFNELTQKDDISESSNTLGRHFYGLMKHICLELNQVNAKNWYHFSE